MSLDKLFNELNEYKKGFTDSRWFMMNHIYMNEYINVLRVDTSNIVDAKSTIGGKLWSIIFERPGGLRIEDLVAYKKLVDKADYIEITPRRNYENQYGLRLRKMSKNPDFNIIVSILEYLFNEN